MLVPAIRNTGNKEIIKGKVGDRHNDIMRSVSFSIYPTNWESGFWHQDHGFLTREQSLKLFGVYDSEGLERWADEIRALETVAKEEN